ncbi:MAG TPA: lipid-A-disaccharide synthase [Pyrinomonadaceae bacterium]|nr:lipid-A-disaccharide synthase [Pyrinomonadaceae bacterium]
MERVGNHSLMIVAGEASGDAHAASLVAALREQDSSLTFFGATGQKMRAAEVESVVRTDELAITGLLEIGGALPRFWRAYRELVAAAADRRPAAVVLVDWPDFNLRLARALRRRQIKVIYYISPQLWAWRAYRLRNIRRDVDLLLAILPFEVDWYRARGVTHVEYVGHPLVGSVRPKMTREVFCRAHNLDAGHPLIALLPGSRRKELHHNLPPMLRAAAIIRRARSDAQFVLALAAALPPAEAHPIIEAARESDIAVSDLPLLMVRDETREALAAADAAAVASGTATLEAAMIGTPLVVVYKESSLNWHTLRRLIAVEHFGLVNLLAGERLAPELMQNDLTPDRLSAELLALLEPEKNQLMRARLAETIAALGNQNPMPRTAKSILEFIRRRRAP